MARVCQDKMPTLNAYFDYINIIIAFAEINIYTPYSLLSLRNQKHNFSLIFMILNIASITYTMSIQKCSP